MLYIDKITKKNNLEKNESTVTYNGVWESQQHYKTFESFFYFIKETRPSRILEIGTGNGGFTFFLKDCCKTLNLDCHILSLDVVTNSNYSEMIKSEIDVRVENIFNESYEDVSDYIKQFISSEGTTIVLCDGDNKKKDFEV